jgi:hypothetical protein
MRRSHVEARSRRYAARQYVADSHDHKPDIRRPKPTAKPRRRKKKSRHRCRDSLNFRYAGGYSSLNSS